MPGADLVKVEPLPQRGSSWPVRVALAGGLVCLVALLFAQPYGHPAGANANTAPPVWSGVLPADAARLPQLEGWHVAQADDFSAAARRVLHESNLEPTGHLRADFSGRGSPADSAYLLVNASGQRRVAMLSAGKAAYDVIFPHTDFLARVPKDTAAKIQWMAQAPKFAPDGDALLVVQDANNPTASMVLLRHGTQTYSARPADFTKIDLAPSNTN